jgi:hypothetical protein
MCFDGGCFGDLERCNHSWILDSTICMLLQDTGRSLLACPSG